RRCRSSRSPLASVSGSVHDSGSCTRYWEQFQIREERLMTGELYSDAARRVINPRLGTGKGGLRLFGDPIQAIESDLTASAVVVASGDARVVVVAIDLCAVSPAEAAEIRSRVGSALRVPPGHVMLNVSHNHSAPALPDFMSMTDSEEEAQLRARYRD